MEVRHAEQWDRRKGSIAGKGVDLDLVAVGLCLRHYRGVEEGDTGKANVRYCGTAGPKLLSGRSTY